MRNLKKSLHENEQNDHPRENALIFEQILSTNKGNVWRTVWRICM